MNISIFITRKQQSCFSSLKLVAMFFTNQVCRKMTAQTYQSAIPSQMMKVGDKYAGKPEGKRPFWFSLKSSREATYENEVPDWNAGRQVASVKLRTLFLACPWCWVGMGSSSVLSPRGDSAKSM